VAKQNERTIEVTFCTTTNQKGTRDCACHVRITARRAHQRLLCSNLSSLQLYFYASSSTSMDSWMDFTLANGRQP
jgi:hypothetical protein